MALCASPFLASSWAAKLIRKTLDADANPRRCSAALPAPKVPQLQFEVSHLNRSLSVLLPVHNSQATLESDVARILDVLPELSREFDVVIVDDASTDATWEIAEDLACRYPQITIARQPIRQGPAPPFAPASRGPRQHRDCPRWPSRRRPPTDRPHLARGRSPRIRANAMAQRAVPRPLASAMLDARSTAIASGGFTLVQPRTVEEIRRDAPSSYERLMRQKPRTAAAELVGAQVRPSDAHTPPPEPKTMAPKKPNFLTRIRSRMKEIALGE